MHGNRSRWCDRPSGRRLRHERSIADVNVSKPRSQWRDRPLGQLARMHSCCCQRAEDGSGEQETPEPSSFWLALYSQERLEVLIAFRGAQPVRVPSARCAESALPSPRARSMSRPRVGQQRNARRTQGISMAPKKNCWTETQEPLHSRETPDRKIQGQTHCEVGAQSSRISTPAGRRQPSRRSRTTLFT